MLKARRSTVKFACPRPPINSINRILNIHYRLPQFWTSKNPAIFCNHSSFEELQTKAGTQQKYDPSFQLICPESFYLTDLSISLTHLPGIGLLYSVFLFRHRGLFNELINNINQRQRVHTRLIASNLCNSSCNITSLTPSYTSNLGRQNAIQTMDNKQRPKSFQYLMMELHLTRLKNWRINWACT